jgi:hypothetical protein
MKKLLLTFTLLFSTLMFSTPSYGEWTKVGKGVQGDTFYVDVERIRKHGGYVYWWDLTDYLKPKHSGHLSDKVYNQGDCKLFRFKPLSSSFHKEPMGNGVPATSTHTPYKDWVHPPPNSVSEIILNKVCSQ